MTPEVSDSELTNVRTAAFCFFVKVPYQMRCTAMGLLMTGPPSTLLIHSLRRREVAEVAGGGGGGAGLKESKKPGAMGPKMAVV